MSRTVWFLVLGWSFAAALGCQQGDQAAAARPAAPPSDPAPAEASIEVKGLHNVFRITDKLLSGSSPEGEAGFRSLKQLGIKTVISVDGAKPEVATARKFGLRYVHLPFGYDGIPRQRILELAKAVRDLPGPVYIHCHHGKHRGPAAAGAIHLCVDEQCSVERAITEMKRAGTDPHYTGLYAVPKNLVRPSTEELDRLPANFPEVAQVSTLAQLMVGIDDRWEKLKLVQAAGWKTSADHPDVEPAHEALQLVEQYREASRLEHVQQRPEEFRRWLAQAEARAKEVELILRAGKDKRARTAADQAFRVAGASCTQCHGKYRDVPQGR
jgi:protein tyrosine phosphatase (PTP) superfamily phosphohydrolase (DUF442 family)